MGTHRTISGTPWRGGSDLETLARHLTSFLFLYVLPTPIPLLDVAVSGYQAVCFRLWRMQAAHRSEPLILAHPWLAALQDLGDDIRREIGERRSRVV